MTDLVQTMFSVREVPWHGKGKVVDHALCAEKAIIEAGLDWEVELHEITVGGVLLESHYGTVRNDNGEILGIVKGRYRVVQNRELFGFFDPVVEEGEALYHTAGVLSGGRKVWLLAKVPEEYYIPGVPDDKIDSFILLASSHDGSLCITIKHTPIRVVCNNTLGAALGTPSTTVSIKHTKMAQYELAAAHRVLGLATKRMGLLQQAAERMAKVQIAPAVMRRYLRKILPSRPEEDGGEPAAVTQNKRDRIEILFLGADTNALEGMKGSAWGLYNATAEWVDHDWQANRGTDRVDRSWFGAGEDLKHKAFRLLMQQVTKGDMDL